MKLLWSRISLVFLVSSLVAWGGVSQHLQLYASFDVSAAPELARGGCGLHSSGKTYAVLGKRGQALHFPQTSDVGDLWYDVGTAMSGEGWTLAMWARLDSPLGYGKGVKPRHLFRTDMGWDVGNIFAGFDAWGHFYVTHLNGAKESGGLVMSNRSFPVKEWFHVAFVYAGGKHRVYVNGIEANVQKSLPAVETSRKPSLLRVGSMDFRSGDQLGGAVDELMLFDRALSAEEIVTCMGMKMAKTGEKPLLYVPFDGEVDPASEVRFNASRLVFLKGAYDRGVNLVRHGYDRLSRLSFQGVSGLGGRAVTVGFHFTPHWDGGDGGVHGLFHVQAPTFEYGLVKRGDAVVFSLQAGERRQQVSLPASVFKREVSIPVLAGFDLESGVLRLCVGDRQRERKLEFPVVPSPSASCSLLLGDTADGNTYSLTQAEGVLDELLCAGHLLSLQELSSLHRSLRQRRLSKGGGLTMQPVPVKEQERALWSLEGAETHRTPTREKVVLNGLWRMQLTSKTMPFEASKWMYLAVPGRYSGQHNGMTDCEFFLRDASLKTLPRNQRYRGKDPYTLTSGWFERAFRLPPAWKGRQVVLLLDELSRSQRGTIYLNGKELTKLKPGYFFEIPLPASSLVFGGDNFLTIHAVDSGAHWNWRGIKGDVWLEARPEITVDYPGLITSVRAGTITFEATIRSRAAEGVRPELRVCAEVRGESAPARATSSVVRVPAGTSRVVRFTIPWKNARLWSPRDPYLYECRFTLENASGQVVDVSHPVRFGFREFELRGRDYYLNGKKIHLFNHDSWINTSGDLAGAREAVRILKGLGYNCVRTNFPADAKDSHRDNIMQACDEEGMLQLVGIDGVTGREFALWNNPETRRELRTRMGGMIRRWRNHPSIIVYFMSTNYLGYGWDYHPLKMADGYVPAFRQKQAEVCQEGVTIMREFDGTRPYFFQAGGNFGEIITSNAYFCWWPQAERNGWPEVWNRMGKKPLHIIETEFPIPHAFFGMDLQHQGAKPLFYYENLARYYGPEVYLDQDAEMAREVCRSTQGKTAQLFYDAPWHQKLRSHLLGETLRCWRGYDISGICPFAEVQYAYRKHAPHRSQYVAKSWPVDPGDFRRSGWHPDLRKITYAADVNPRQPLPVATAFKEALAPRLVMVGGAHGDVADRTHSGFSGDALERDIILINDTDQVSRFSGHWKFAGQSEAFEQTLEPGESRRIAITLRLPEVTQRKTFTLTVRERQSKPVNYGVTVFPPVGPAPCGTIALYDPRGMTAATLRHLGIPFKDARTLTSLQGIDLLVIGREALTPELMSLMRALGVRAQVDSGRVNVLVMEQHPASLALLGMRALPVYARQVFASPQLLDGGLAASDFSDWAGVGTLSPSHEAPTGSEVWVPSPLWHWSNRNMVSSYPLLRPTEGAYRILLSCGKDLLYTPLCELRSGRGAVLFCQLEISGRSRREPAGEHLLAGLLRRYSRPLPAVSGGVLLAPSSLSQEALPGLLAQVRQGAVLLAPPGSARLFGLQTTDCRVERFTLTAAGRRTWGDFTARDLYLRAPQQVQSLSGSGLVPLTSPSFAAELPLGSGKVIFLEVSTSVQEEEARRGRSLGLDSSVLWSACRTRDRFRQLRNLLLAAHGHVFPSLASRLEAMRLPEQKVALEGEWLLRTDPADQGLKQGWHLSGTFGQNRDWLKVAVPGYFNHQLPQVGQFIGPVWYRRTVQLPPAMRGRKLYLEVGAVDDLDDTYVNGVKIGHTGEDTSGYWAAHRRYAIPEALTATGHLELALRTVNLRGNGGICDYVRIVCPGATAQASPYPYAEAGETYHTEHHVRW